MSARFTKIFILLIVILSNITVNAIDYKKFIEQHDIDDVTKSLKSDNPKDFWESMINNNLTFQKFLSDIQQNRGAEKEAKYLVAQVPKFDIKYREEVVEEFQDECDRIFKRLGNVEGIEHCVVEDKTVNAFTTYSNDGMVVGLNLGLWGAKGMTDEILIGIAAHEYAHAHLFHILKQAYGDAKRKRRNNLIEGLAIATASAGHAIGNFLIADAGIEPTDDKVLLEQAYNLSKSYHEDLIKYHYKFSRELELEADLVAYRFLEWAGIGGENYIEAIKLMGAHSPENYSDDDESDHPSHRERIEFLTYVMNHPEIGNSVNEKMIKAEKKKQKFGGNNYDPIYD